MDFTPLEQDADRALKELLPILRPNEELDIAVIVRDVLLDVDDQPLPVGAGLQVNACMKVWLAPLECVIQVNSRNVTTGPALWGAMVHELAHVYQAELTASLEDIETHYPGSRPLMRGALRGLEMANRRVERLILRAYPCPPWLKDRTYDAPGGDA